MTINLERFNKISRGIPITELAKIMGINRTLIHKAKNGKPVGSKFIMGFKRAFPFEKIEDYFFCWECVILSTIMYIQ